MDAVVGYTLYIDLIRPLVEGKKIFTTPMMQEIRRVDTAVDMALDGMSVALVSSGDPGIYAMAGLVFEKCRDKGVFPGLSREASRPSGGIRIEVIPGIPALCAGAALLGAPLTHDFAVVSLSDLLTPWEVIERRLDAAAAADFVLVLYNPKSKKRTWQLEKAREIILRHRRPEAPVGVVTRAMRKDQSVRITTLQGLSAESVDMQTIVFVGNSNTVAVDGIMATPRGYARKYGLCRSS